jgi:eukaryotic-like serine/threonine-protein kinase
MPLAAGTTLGQYEIRSPLGAGGMGEVYRAHDTRLDREVAIKVLPASVTSDPDRLRRFEQEARAAAALNHPNILAVYQMATHEGVSYMVTELLDGETLRERVRRGPIPLRKAIDYAGQIAHGLAAAHEKGIAHRDLKPENLFVTKDGRVKILDFGLAKLTQPKDSSGVEPTLAEATEPGVVMGTVGYMSPEQVRGKTADHRSDVFAFGAILYEMVTGKQTFRKPTKADTISAILNEEPPPISQVAPNTPPGLQRVVHRCLEKDPEQRFHSAHDLAFALEASSESSSSVISVADQKPRSRRALVIGVGAGAVVVVAAALIAWWRTTPAVPVVESVTQLTDDGEPKQDRLVTDGSRIYFNEGSPGSLKIAQVAVTGGPTSVIPTRIPSPQIAGLTREGSVLLVIAEPSAGMVENNLWTIPLPTGEPRRLGDLGAGDGSFSPEGRILFAKGGELYLAEQDGSHPRKLVSVGGFIGEPSLSSDGQRLIFTHYSTFDNPSLFEANSDGSGVQPLLNPLQNSNTCCAEWTPNGRFLLFSKSSGGIRNIWVLPVQTGFSRRSREPVRLTNGPLTYSGPVPGRDGKQIFAIGTKRRGELVRYDGKSRQFSPVLSGISAIDPTFSADGKWVAYTAYPDHSLWRSRADGTDRLQLTYPPVRVAYPFISPDAKRVAFWAGLGQIYVVSMDGGTPQTIVEKDGGSATWSPDGNVLAVSYYNGIRFSVATYDFRSGRLSPLPSSQGLIGAQWLTQETLVAYADAPARLVSFDLRTQKWSDLVLGPVVNWAMSPDYKYLYYTTGGAEPEAFRMRIADHKVETITSLKDLRRVTDWLDNNTQISVSPDGSAVFTRDIGTQEIYALTVKWP